MKPNKIMKLFERTNTLSKPQRFFQYLNACVADAKGRGAPKCNEEYTQNLYLKKCLEAVLTVNTKEISTKLLQENKSGIMIGEAIRVTRINAIRCCSRDAVE
jgi:tRNA nucleotidyltransferase (CCA-adding enzyme)